MNITIGELGVYAKGLLATCELGVYAQGLATCE